MNTKVCTKCGKELPATTEYFSKDKRLKCGFRPNCKECNKQYYEENKDRMAEQRRKNKEGKAEYNRLYYENNKERIAEYNREYYEENREYHRQYCSQHYKENREQYRSRLQKRRTLERELPATLTADQWEHAQSFFNHRCAYCERKMKLAQEHFYALSRGGGYTVTNIIPVCKSCNSSKSNKLFEDWYPTHESYSPEREAKIYEYFDQLEPEND